MPKHTDNLKITAKKSKREGLPRHNKVLPENLPATQKSLSMLKSSPSAGTAVVPASPDKPAIKRYEIDPLALTFPERGGEPLEALAENIKRNGQFNPTTTLAGKILDGHRRYAACLIAGVELRTAPLPPNTDPLEYVVAQNLHRRDMSPSTRAIAAAKLMPHYAARAAERKKLLSGTRSNPDGSKTQVPEIVPGPDQCGEARELAAKAAGANPRYVSDAVRLQREAPELFKAVESGAKTIPAAIRQLGKKAPVSRRIEHPRGHETANAKDEAAPERPKDAAPGAFDTAATLERFAAFICRELVNCPRESADSLLQQLVSMLGLCTHTSPQAQDPALLLRRMRQLYSSESPSDATAPLKADKQ